MSFWVSLCSDGNLCDVGRHSEGGTYVVGGVAEASLNVTYNYSKHYYEHLNTDKGLRWLDGKTAKETIAALDHAVKELGTNHSSDYWESSAGNAGYGLNILLSWAKEHPDAKWEVH